LDALPSCNSDVTFFKTSVNLFDPQGGQRTLLALPLQNGIIDKWHCSRLFCRPIIAPAADDKLPTETAVLLLW